MSEPESPEIRQDRHRIRLLFTGNTLGYIDPCDCGGGVLGGLDRRSATLRDLLGQNRPTVLFDLGNLFEVPYDGQLSELGRRQARYLSDEMERMDYQFMALGYQDLTLDPLFLAEHLPHLDSPPLLTNRSTDQTGLMDTLPRIRLELGGLTLDFFNVIEPDLVTRPGLLTPWRDSLRDLLRESEHGKDPADLQVVIAHVAWETSESMPEVFPAIDVIINGFMLLPRQGIRVGNSVAMTAVARGQKVAVLELTSRSLLSQRTGESAILEFQGRHIELKQTSLSDPGVYERMTAFLQELKRDNLIPP
ncbi:hypothetical protein ACFL44_01310 [Gemmatimonadota bacterium]